MKTHEELLNEGFFYTDPDTNQWVKKISETNFIVYEKEQEFDIDLTFYTEDELEEVVSGYYNSLAALKDIYGKDANQIIAECIAETDYL